jgi:hypothetical protein
MPNNPQDSEIVLYTTPDGTIKIDTVFQDETIWLTQKKTTVSKMETVQTEGIRATNQSKYFYNLDAFLEFNEQDILTHAGKIKAEIAKKVAKDRYEEFDHNRKKDEARAAYTEDLLEIEKIEKTWLNRNHDT